MVGCRAWISARNTLSAGNGHVWSPMTPMMALHARLRTNRYSTRKRISCLLAGGLGVGAHRARAVTPVRLRRGLGELRGGLLRTPRHELTVLGDRGLDQLIEDVVGRVADKPCIEHERIAVRLLQPADVTHDLDPMGTRLDERHRFSFSSAARHGGDRDGTTEGSRAVPSRDPVLRDG